MWIPRYRYKIFNEGLYDAATEKTNQVQTIEIEFENKDTPISNGSKVGEWLSHPAFQPFDVNGMWVGKFETGYKGAGSKTGAQENSNDVSKIQIKPNVYSWTFVSVSNAFTASYNYQRNLESHIMKNTEWGSVAYLHHSVYGSKREMATNNNFGYMTGYASTCKIDNISCNQTETTNLNVDGNITKRYHTEVGVLASNTANISGIYDMNGGTK